MNKVKSYTDLEQSRKLAEILPLESADMHYKVSRYRDECMAYMIPYLSLGTFKDNDYEVSVPSWTLAALLRVLPFSSLDSSIDNHYRISVYGMFSDWHDNPIDACYEMILKLHEQNLL